MTNKYLNSIFALAVACGISSAQAATDWFWHGPAGDEGGLTSVGGNWSSNGQGDIAAMVFSKDAFDKTIVFDQFYNVGSDVYFGIHNGTPDWASTDEYTFVLKATSSEMGVVAPGRLSVAGWGGAPICRVRIEGGTYTFGDASECGWGDIGVMVGDGNWGYLDLVSGTITCLNNFWLSNSKQPFNGVVTVGGGDDLAVISVTNKAVTKLRGGDGNSGYGSLTLKTNGVFKTNYIVWDNDLATMTFDGGTLVKNGDLSMGQETASRVGSGREGLICGDGSYNNGTARTINITSNGGTIQCDYPVLIESAFALTNDATSAVLTKTGSEKFTWRGNRPGVGLDVQAGTANILASQPLASLAIASGGTLEVDCTGCSGDSLTIVPASGTVTLPSGVSASSVVTPVGDGASDYTASYSATTGLVLSKGGAVDPEPEVVTPTIGSATPAVNGQSVTITLANVVKGTDANGVAAEKYDVYAQTGSETAVKVAPDQTEATASFTLSNLAAGSYTYSVYITNDKNVQSGSKTVEFTIEEPQPTHTHVWGEWEVYTPATATEAGERRRYCTAEGCSDPVAYESEVIPATGGGDDPIVDPPTTTTEYHWMGAAPDSATAPHILAWSDSANWTDADGNAVSDYPHQAGDVAVFHGMAQGYVAEIAAGETIVLDELRFAEGNSLLGCSLTAHVVVDRLVISDGAVWELASDDPKPQYEYGNNNLPVTNAYDFTVGNHAEVMANGAACIRGALGHRTYKQDVARPNDSDNMTSFNRRLYVTIDENGKLFAIDPSTQAYNGANWANTGDYGYAVGLFCTGAFQGLSLGPSWAPEGGGHMTVLSGQYVAMNDYIYWGREADMPKRGSISSPTGRPLYHWPYSLLIGTGHAFIHTAVNAEEFVHATHANTVIYSDHTADAVNDYVIAAGTLSLGGTVYNGSLANASQKSCSMNDCDYTIDWTGTLSVECENPFDSESSINVRSYNKTGARFGKINLAYDGEVKSLLIDGVAQAAGTYGSTSSGAANKNDAIFSGTGVLTVTVGSEDPVDPPTSTVISTVDGFTMRRRCLGNSPDTITTLVDATNALAHGYVYLTEENCHSPSQTVVVAGYHVTFDGRFNYDVNGGVGGGYPGTGRYDRGVQQLIGATGRIVVPSAGKWTFCVGAREYSYVSLSIKGEGIDDVFETWQTGPNYGPDNDGEVRLVTVDFPTANATYDVEILQYSSNADIWLEFSAAKGEYTKFNVNDFVLVGDSVTEYTVTFDSNGGSEVAAQTVRENRTATRPTDPTKSDCTFDGWTLNDADYDFTAPVLADITLVAKWTQNEPDEPTHEHVWSETWTTNRAVTAMTSGERQRACTVEGCTEVQKQLLIATDAPGASVDPATVNRATGDVSGSYTDRSAGALMSQTKTYTDGSFTLPYRLHVPQAATSEGTVKYPLVLFLHGAGERGSDNGNQLNNCVGTICSYALAHGDAYIVAPQCPAGDDTTATWAGVGWGGTSMTRNADPTPQMQAVMDLIYDLVEENPSIDPTRIYVTGISMGGFGTWDIVSRMPDNTFAAMMPVCGGADATQAALYEGETIRFFHGGSDPTVSPVYSQSMDAALTTAGIAHDYIEYEGVDHVGCWADDKAYATANLDWLFGKVRTTVPAEASEEPEEPDEDETVWTSAPLSATAAEIATTGTLVYAYTRQASTDPATLTVNTVPFTCVTANANESYTSSDFDLDFTSENGSYDFNEKVDSSTDFLKLLGGGWYQRTQNNSFERELTLKNLTVGKKYLVQLVSHWTNHKSRLYAPGSDSIYVDGATDGEKSEGITDSRDWTYGGVLNGIFTATDTTMIFTLRGVAPYFVAVNAIQVRDITDAEDVVAPAIGTASASVNGQDVTISLSSVVIGTDTEGVAATAYDVFAQTGSDAAAKVAEGETGTSASFTLENLADGSYTYSVYITNNFGVASASKSVSFKVGADVPDPGDNPVDWKWIGSSGTTSTASNWNNYTLPIKDMIFSDEAYDQTIVFDGLYAVNGTVRLGYSDWGKETQSEEVHVFTWQANAADYGIVSPNGLFVPTSNNGRSPVSTLRIEGGAYSFGNPDNVKYDSAGVVACSGDNDGIIEVVGGRIDCLNHLWPSQRWSNRNGTIIIGDGVGDSDAVVSVTNVAVVMLGQDLSEGYTATLTLRKGGILETSFIIWPNDRATLTLDGGTIVKNGNLETVSDNIASSGDYNADKVDLLCGNNNNGYYGSNRTIQMTENGGTIQCDYPVLIDASIVLTSGVASAVLTKTGDKALTLRCANAIPANGTQPAFGVSVQEGDLNVLAGTKFPSVELGENGRLVIDCDGYTGTYYTIVEPGGSVTFPEDADLTELIVPIGVGSSKYAASYSPETGLVLGPNLALAEAEIDGVRYATLELAAAQVKKDETITVLRDIVYEEARTVTIPNYATLDLNGHSITFYDYSAEDAGDHSTAWMTDDAIVFLEGGVIKNGSLLEPADTVYIDDYTTAGHARIKVGSGENEVTLSAENLIVGDAAGHEPFCVFRANKGARVNISGGTYHAATLFAGLDGSSLCYINGGSFYLRGFWYHHPTGYTGYHNGDFYIYGGAFSLPPDAYYVKDSNVTLHDVTNTELPYSVVDASDALYTESGWSYHYVNAAAAESARVAKRTVDGTDVFYTSLFDAVNAAVAAFNGGAEEDVITLVADVNAFDRSVEAAINVGKRLLIDGAGHTVKVRTPFVAETGYVASNFTLEFPYLIHFTGGDFTMRDIHIMGGGVVNSRKYSGECYAIYNHDGANLKLENVTVTRSNGAIMNRDAKLYAEDCRFVRNCRYCAGAIYNYGFAVLERSSLSENRSLADGGGGGAIENPGMLYINNCVFCNNSSTEIGGAINNYASWLDVGLYMMNTTLVGNFSATRNFSHNKQEGYEDYGGAIGFRAYKAGTFLGVNNLIVDNYQVYAYYDNTDKAWVNTTKASDMSALCETCEENENIHPNGMTNRLYYTVYQTFDYEQNTVLNGCVREIAENNSRLTNDQTAQNVFNDYYLSKRIFQNALETTADLSGAQLVSKDDGSLNAELARYAPIKRTLNEDGTYTYGDAVLSTNGVYTFFDASDWTNGIVRMGYAPVVGEVAYGDDDELNHVGTIVPLGDVPLASAEYMVTNYYERIGGRSFGVTGASGWLDEDIVYYTVRLARDPENGSATGITLYGDTYADGTTITLTATPGFAREFLGWYIVDQTTGTETLIEGSNKTIWELTVDQDYVLVPKFSDILEYLTPEPSVHAKMADDDPTAGPALYPITVTTKWMTDHYSDIIPDEDTSFIDYLAHMVETSTVEVAKAWLTEILEETDSATGLKMWQDYVLGIEPGDPNGKIWINSPQYMSTGKNLVRMEMNKLTPVKGTKFTINYRLDKKLGTATDFSRADVNTTGSYDVNVTTDPSGLYVIDLLFIPEGKATSEEYVTTVNTAGVLRVSNTAGRAAIAVPWTKLQPTGSSDVSALDLVKTTNLTPGDILYVYDDKSETKNYRAWKMADNGNWVPLNVFQLDEDGLVNWTNTLAAAEGSTVARGLGVWLERANTNDYIYVCGQYEAAPVTSTPLSKGWNLVGNPSGAAFDLSTLTPAEGDQIVVPTAAEPKTYTYENGAWGYWKTTTVEYGGKQYIKSVRKTDDTIVPAGVGFWYISEGKEAINW